MPINDIKYTMRYEVEPLLKPHCKRLSKYTLKLSEKDPLVFVELLFHSPSPSFPVIEINKGMYV